jgi:hypothetical protein
MRDEQLAGDVMHGLWEAIRALEKFPKGQIHDLAAELHLFEERFHLAFYGAHTWDDEEPEGPDDE